MPSQPVAPPPPPPPPPVSGVPSQGGSARQDNPIAIAAIITSLLALILAIIVIGGVIGIISFVLAAVALRRSRRGAGGKGIAITAMMLSIIAVIASVGAVFIAVNEFQRGEDTVLDGIVSSSDNDDFPPQRDLDAIECSVSNSGTLGQAVVTLTNLSLIHI